MNRAQRRRAAKLSQPTAGRDAMSFDASSKSGPVALSLLMHGAFHRAIEVGKKEARKNNRRFTVHPLDLDQAVDSLLADLERAGVIQFTVRVGA